MVVTTPAADITTSSRAAPTPTAVTPIEAAAAVPPPPPPKLGLKRTFGVDGRPERVTAKYVLIGSGTASYFALRGIREKDPDAKVLIIGEEEELPYMRTPLSKELWFKDQSAAGAAKDGGDADLTFTDWGGQERSVFYEKEDFYCDAEDLAGQEGAAVGLLLGEKVVDLNIRLKRLRMADGRVVVYDKVLLATGGTPKNLAVFENAPPSVQDHVNLFRTAKDFRRLETVMQGGKRVAVIGGGFLGSELAVALARCFGFGRNWAGFGIGF
jgi:programmed cell death 8 (apoptosis-inducing factor)